MVFDIWPSPVDGGLTCSCMCLSWLLLSSTLSLSSLIRTCTFSSSFSTAILYECVCVWCTQGSKCLHLLF